MRKRMYFLFVCILIATWGKMKAQNEKAFEGEMKIALTTPMGDYHQDTPMMGPGLGLEFRYNIPSSKWDCGIGLNLTTAIHKYKIEGYTSDQSNRSLNLMLVGDYNFRQGKKVNPYLGCGLGFSFYDTINDVVYESSGTTFGIQPRAGLELFHHLRVAATFLINRKGYNNFELSVGVVFGGRPKKE